MAQKQGLMLVASENGLIRAEEGSVPKGFTVYGHFPMFTVYRRSEGKRPSEDRWIMFLYQWCQDNGFDFDTFQRHKRGDNNKYGD